MTLLLYSFAVFFTTYNHDYYYNYNNRTHHTNMKIKTKTTIQPLIYSNPISLVIWLFCYYANVLAVFFFLLSSLPLLHFQYCFCVGCILLTNSNTMMEFDPIHDIIARNATFFILGALPATSPSSFVFPTPKFRDKELHPYSRILFLFFLLVQVY